MRLLTLGASEQSVRRGRLGSDCMGKRIAGVTGNGSSSGLTVRRQSGYRARAWRQEVSNTLLILLRRKKLTRPEWLDGLALLDVLPVVVDNHAEKIALTFLAHLAEETGLTVYDAAYLELARRKRIPLASRDNALNKACLAAGVEVMKLATK